MKPQVIVITGYGINCEEETAYCFNQSGAQSKIVHINDLIDGSEKLLNYQILAIPGGFSYGDDTGSGNAFANKMRNNIGEAILKFACEDKLILGVCNGFQVITNLGLLPAVDGKYYERQAALMHNKQARYECRWIHIKNTTERCIWTKGIDVMHVPVAHGEGNFYCEEEVLNKIKVNDQIAFKYCKPDGSDANQEYPFNPNGALEDIAAITDPSGRILGMMPHPERFNCFANEYDWPLKKEQLLRNGQEIPKEGDGLKFYKNAVQYFQ